jgi:uncharacterized membrane protein
MHKVVFNNSCFIRHQTNNWLNMKKLLFSWDELKATFWFIPVLIIVTALCLAFGLIYIDSVAEFQPGKTARYLFTGSADSARQVLSIIAGAMIGVAGTVFSITLVVLSLASSQFGPRILKNFMYDRINQVVLGTYISTFIYCLIVLNSIKGGDDFTFVPIFSVLFSLIVSVGNIVLLIIFIHHTAVSIQADNIIANIYESLSGSIKKIDPDDEGQGIYLDTVVEEEQLKMLHTYRYPVKVLKSGYLQYLDRDSFLEFAVKHQALIEVFCRPGDYLVEGMELGTVFSNKKMEGKELDQCKSYYRTGRVRTPQQDIEHSIHQIVEIACRAISPGINDPFTAIACIDNLTSTLCYLSGIKFPSRHRFDKEGTLRLIVKPLTYEGVVDAAFNQIRQFGYAIPSVAIRMMEAFIVITNFVNEQAQKDIIKKHALMVLNMAKNSFEEPNDLNDLKEKSSMLLKEE